MSRPETTIFGSLSSQPASEARSLGDFSRMSNPPPSGGGEWDPSQGDGPASDVQGQRVLEPVAGPAARRPGGRSMAGSSVQLNLIEPNFVLTSQYPVAIGCSVMHDVGFLLRGRRDAHLTERSLFQQ